MEQTNFKELLEKLKNGQAAPKQSEVNNENAKKFLEKLRKRIEEMKQKSNKE